MEAGSVEEQGERLRIHLLQNFLAVTQKLPGVNALRVRGSVHDSPRGLHEGDHPDRRQVEVTSISSQWLLLAGVF